MNWNKNGTKGSHISWRCYGDEHKNGLSKNEIWDNLVSQNVYRNGSDGSSHEARQRCSIDDPKSYKLPKLKLIEYGIWKCKRLARFLEPLQISAHRLFLTNIFCELNLNLHFGYFSLSKFAICRNSHCTQKNSRRKVKAASIRYDKPTTSFEKILLSLQATSYEQHFSCTFRQWALWQKISNHTKWVTSPCIHVK